MKGVRHMAAQKNQRGIRIPEDVKAFVKMDYKKFKKKNKKFHLKKKMQNSAPF